VVFTPEMVGQVIISGVLSGALYAMVALGLALIFGVMRVINIAHGPLLMLGAYVTFFLYSRLGMNPFLTVPCRWPRCSWWACSCSGRWCSGWWTRRSCPRCC